MVVLEKKKNRFCKKKFLWKINGKDQWTREKEKNLNVSTWNKKYLPPFFADVEKAGDEIVSLFIFCNLVKNALIWSTACWNF